MWAEAMLVGGRKTMKISKASCSLAVIAVVLTGCAGAGGGAGPPSFSPPSTQGRDPGSTVVLQVQGLGEIAGHWSMLSRLPGPSVYADGRVVREIDQFATPVDQLPALPQVVQQKLTPTGLDALLQRARAAGVGDDADLGEPPIADAGTTRFVMATEDGPAWSDAYALRESAGQIVEVGQPVPSPSIPVGSGGNDGTFTREQADARYKLLELSTILDDLPAAVGASEVSEQVPYQPRALAVIVAPDSADPALPALAWPGPALLGQDVKVGGASCTVVHGADLDPVLDAAGRARLKTPWTDGGHTWGLRFRPLLPDENTCEDLAAVSPDP